jgi:hypothetical protein
MRTFSSQTIDSKQTQEAFLCVVVDYSTKTERTLKCAVQAFIFVIASIITTRCQG